MVRAPYPNEDSKIGESVGNIVVALLCLVLAASGGVNSFDPTNRPAITVLPATRALVIM